MVGPLAAAAAAGVFGQYDDADDDNDDQQEQPSSSSSNNRKNILVDDNEQHQHHDFNRTNNDNNNNNNNKQQNDAAFGDDNDYDAGENKADQDSSGGRGVDIDVDHAYDDEYHLLDDDDDDYDDDDDWLKMTYSLPNKSSSSSLNNNNNNYSSSHHLLNSLSLSSKNSFGTTTSKLSHSVSNDVIKMMAMEQHKRTITQGRDDRATSEQVLDPRTRLILFKLLSRGFIEQIDGCLSTGKEANVYYAIAGKQEKQQQEKQKQKTLDDVNNGEERKITEYAIKIYKTSILVFKDREKYVAGEHRWSNGNGTAGGGRYCRSKNPRKMVQLWAEKEMRNYKRIYNAGISCPKPVLLKSNVFVMEFLGTNGWPAPRLKDAINGVIGSSTVTTTQSSSPMSSTKKIQSPRIPSSLQQLYIDIILMMRHLYQRCKLVHGDLSEYNLLWYQEQVYMIDVSQSVETDHPLAYDFLRRDCANINDFFIRQQQKSTTTSRHSIGDDEGHRSSTSSTSVMGDCDNDAEDDDDDDAVMIIMSTKQLFEYIITPFTVHDQECNNPVVDKTEIDRLNLILLAERQRQQQQRSSSQQEPSTKKKKENNENNNENETMAEDEIGRNQFTNNKNKNNNSNVDEAVFMKSFIPRSLNEVSDAEIQKLERGDVEETYAKAVASMTGNPAVVKQQQKQQQKTEGSSDDDDDDIDDDESSSDADDGNTSSFIKVARTADELQAERNTKKMERKENKKAVKEAKSEKRQNKMKKKDKKRAMEKTKSGNRKNK